MYNACKGDFMKKIKKYYIYIFLFIFVIALITAVIVVYNNHKSVTDFSNINLKNTEKVMIVAHPDDEILWGGAHLLEDNYLVVCVTCKDDSKRAVEFTKAMKATNDKFIMLGYPDKTNGERDNWQLHKQKISNDLQKIIELKDWHVIVTHNPEGEYGHIHHKIINELVTDVSKTKGNLYYFGRYYTKKTIINHYNELSPINDTYSNRKKQIIGMYKSQSFIQTMFNHMFEYEEWIPYNEWSEQSEQTN